MTATAFAHRRRIKRKHASVMQQKKKEATAIEPQVEESDKALATDDNVEGSQTPAAPKRRRSKKTKK